MTPVTPVRFLIRGSILLIVILVLWRTVLVDPLLMLLRFQMEGILPSHGTVAGAATSDWYFTFPLTLSGATYTANVTIPRKDIVAFTFAIPVYWAISLAMPLGKAEFKSWLFSLIAGTVLVDFINILLLLTFLNVQIWKILQQVRPTAGGFTTWGYSLAEYLAVAVIPYIAPILTAISFHKELRKQIFRSAE